MKLSIITICKNEFNNIEKTIESVINQEFTDYEYIIIDGGSIDGTIDIINKYNSQISKFISEKDDGIFTAMNKAINIAKGEYIIFLNSGDYFVNNKVIFSVMNSTTNSDIIYGDVIFKYSNGFLMRRKSPINPTFRYFYIDSINHQSAFIKRELYLKAGLFDLSLKITADYDFILKSIFSFKCTLHYCPLPISIFNLEGISSRRDLFDLQNKERRICLERYFTKDDLLKMDRFKILIDLFFKKSKYLYYFILSTISRRYLYE